jgi:hypothetical protein
MLLHSVASSYLWARTTMDSRDFTHTHNGDEKTFEFDLAGVWGSLRRGLMVGKLRGCVDSTDDVFRFSSTN